MMKKSNMNDTWYGQAALKKMGDVPENFFFYAAGWLEDHPDDFNTMEVTGAVFREAKTGVNKGSLCIKVKGTERTVYVQADKE